MSKANNYRTIHAFFPASFANIARLILIVLIGTALGFILWGQSHGFFAKEGSVKGVESSAELDELMTEIKKTEAVLLERPDYARAWLRLAALYAQVGEEDLEREALNKARVLEVL